MEKPKKNQKPMGTGKVTKHVGELHSRKDSPATVSFGYFRTKSGLPPSVEERYEKEGKRLP